MKTPHFIAGLSALHCRNITHAGCLFIVTMMATATGLLNAAESLRPVAPEGLWSHDNLVAWCVVPFDAMKRGPEERAEMLSRLGFKHFAYDWRQEHIPTFDTEIEALKNRGIELLAWWFPSSADDPVATATLEVFKRHGVHPQLWVALGLEGFHKTAEAQKELVHKTADVLAPLVKLASAYQCHVELYNHNGWFGMVENQVAIIERLKEMGVTGVGMVYNFSHARDAQHDDSTHFPELWRKIQPYVVAVNITGMRMEGEIVYPGQGDRELSMMQTIQESGWQGPIGLIAEKGGDAEITLSNYIVGLDWLAAELKRPGSGGPRPFPLAP